MIRRLWWNMGRAAVYFLAGAVLDAIVTAYTAAVSAHQPLLASVLSSAITLFSVFFLRGMMSGEGRKGNVLIVAYALGNGVGTAIVMLLR
jgi:hypothetical protein